MDKVSRKTPDLDNTKITSIISYRGGDLTDATRLYRKEQILKKKLKVILQSNAHLEKDIKSHEAQIKDERASVQFQLGDLLKEMGLKFGLFTEEKLERDDFCNNNEAHKALQEMMGQYELIQKECWMMGKVFESLQKIQSNYRSHSRDMESMVLESESLSQEYQSNMEDNIHTVCEQIKERIAQNQQLDSTTQQLARDIDGFVLGMVELKEEEEKVVAKIDKLKKMANCQQQKVNEISEWAEIVIDKSNRKTVQKTMKEKESYLRQMQQRNAQLQIYLNELANQEEKLKSDKENASRPKSKSKKKVEKRTKKSV